MVSPHSSPAAARLPQTPPALCTCREGTLPRWRRLIPAQPQRSGALEMCRHAGREAGEKPFSSTSESRALSDPTARHPPSQAQLLVAFKEEKESEAARLKGDKRRHLSPAPPRPSPSHLHSSVSALSAHSKVTESPRTSPSLNPTSGIS